MDEPGEAGSDRSHSGALLMRNRLFLTLEDINPHLAEWPPTPLRPPDPDPNPRLTVGAPVRPSTLGELFDWYKKTRTVEELLMDIGEYRSRDR